MTGRPFWFDRQGRPITIQEAEPLLADLSYKIIAKYEEGGHLVLTVWLGADYDLSPSGPPILFQTMIFDAARRPAEYLERYPTEAAALAGHDQAVMHLRIEILQRGDDT
ncbi:hypothetical protein [Spirillospora sp. NBC_01491]|uniref:hypothetical protein n=1 Tax=Spirillospora sp. NBC_01491 TaxID=2976007 RepID=UPI002E361A04|nr:hypothetical protein [Spirillospora sp. NBC_01491]